MPKAIFAEFKKSIDVAGLYLSYEDGSNIDEMYYLIQQIKTFVLAIPSKIILNLRFKKMF